MLLKMSKAITFTRDLVVPGYIFVSFLGMISFCHFCSPTVLIKPCDLHIIEIAMFDDINHFAAAIGREMTRDMGHFRRVSR